MVECKYSFSKNADLTKFRKQFDKYLNPSNKNYINVENKKVVLAIKEFKAGANVNHPVIKNLKRQNIIIITNINQLKTLF